MFLPTLAILIACAGPPTGHAAPAAGSGPEWFQGNWDQLLAKARETDKPVFLDFWTDW